MASKHSKSIEDHCETCRRQSCHLCPIAEVIESDRIKSKCLNCEKDFTAYSKYNRLCDTCKKSHREMGF